MDFLEMLQPHITAIVGSILTILSGIVLAGLATLKRKVDKWLDSKTTNEQKQLIDKWAGDAFSFAETVFRDLNGQEKLSHAIQYLSDKLKENGIVISEEEIRAAIEKAVLEFNLIKKG